MLLAARITQHIAHAIAFPYETKGWAEGHLLYNAIQLSRGENPYVDPAAEVPTAFAYGFFYPLTMVPLVLACGPKLWIGRVISTLATTGTLGMLFLLARRRAGHWTAGALAVAFSLTTYEVTCESWDWTHPDSLFLMLGLASVTAVEGMRSERIGTVILAAVLAAMSFLTKQTGAGFIAGLAVFLTLGKARRGGIFVAVSLAMLTIVLVIAQILTQGWYLRYTMNLMASHAYEVGKIYHLFFDRTISSLGRPPAVTTPLLLVAGIYQVVKQTATAPREDPLPYVIIGVGIPAFAAMAKEFGVNNNLTPVLLCLTVPASVCFVRLFHASAPRPVLRILLATALWAQAVLALKQVDEDDQISRTQLAVGDLVQAEVRATKGPLLMGHLISFAYLNGRDVYDSIAMTLEFGHGGFSNWSRLRGQLERQFFRKIILPEHADFALTEELKDVLKRKYKVLRVIGEGYHRLGFSPVYVLVPRNAA